MPRRSFRKTASSPMAWIKRLAKSCPPELLAVVDLLQTYPGRAIAILDMEIQHRRNALGLVRQARRFILWRFSDALQGFLVMSALILSLLWTFHGVARLREWVHNLDARFLPGGEAFYLQLKYFFTSSPFGAWPWEIPTLIIALLVIGLFARHLGVMLFSWREILPLRVSMRSIERELVFLETWRQRAEERTADA